MKERKEGCRHPARLNTPKRVTAVAPREYRVGVGGGGLGEVGSGLVVVVVVVVCVCGGEGGAACCVCSCCRPCLQIRVCACLWLDDF